MKQYHKKFAVITGASSGIGYQLAHCFAKEGYDIVAIGRCEAQLTQLVNECYKEYHSFVRPFVIDLAQLEAVPMLIDFLNKLDEIEVLVNNAGFGVWGPFTLTNVDIEQQMIQVQINSMLVLTKYMILRMEKKQKGYILNVASLYSFTPVPLQSVYSATKAFLSSFTQSLRVELQDSDIVVSLLCPGLTETNFRSRFGLSEETSWASMSAQKVALAGYKGLMQNKAIIIPGWYNIIYVLIAKWLPNRVLASFVAVFMSRFRAFKLPHSTQKTGKNDELN